MGARRWSPPNPRYRRSLRTLRRISLFQVLDDQRKWWKVQDQRGQKGYVPYNILTPHPGPRGRCSLVSRGRLLGPEGRGARGSDPENKGRGG